ncbi:hypothetical protein BKA66DRAFT_516631 [Pyrenochaeta sp. MPI-SDFR-AT-0127]|nr:hypothetical protein BKA66DRAFT_516631 [Pyrenochaeta sp. MPI-SDFR-AT-0127]
MLRRTLLRPVPRPPQILRKPYTRQYTTEPVIRPPSSQSRIERFNSRLPKFLHKYTNALANAPLSHITSFLLLHEITAVIPLFGLAGYFHYTHWLPSWFAEGAWIASGVERFGRYFKRKGWIRSEEAAEATREVQEFQKDVAWKDWMRQKGWMRSNDVTEENGLRKVDYAWNISEGGVRLVVEFATAYAIVKMFLIPRILFSVWATPWFARMTVIPFLSRFKKSLGVDRKLKRSGAPMIETEAVKGQVLPRNGSASFNLAAGRMCFDDRDTCSTRTYLRSGRQYDEATGPYGMSWRRRHDLGGAYYPSRYYTQLPTGRYVGNYRQSYGRRTGMGYSTACGPGHGRRYLPAARATMPGSAATAIPKPRHQYIYTPRYGQRGLLSYAGQQPNGAYPAGVMPGGYSFGHGLVGAGVGIGAYPAGGGGYYPAVHNAPPHYPYSYGATYSAHIHRHPAYGGYFNYGQYGSMYPFANLYSLYQGIYYNRAPSYGYHTHVYPPGPTTTTTTYHVTNSQAPTYPRPRVETRTTCHHGSTREAIQMENRRVATERGAYDPRRIQPADARNDDPFWCRERNGEWHLRTFYQIQNECQPGRWMMDADMGFLVFHRE